MHIYISLAESNLYLESWKETMENVVLIHPAPAMKGRVLKEMEMVLSTYIQYMTHCPQG